MTQWRKWHGFQNTPTAHCPHSLAMCHEATGPEAGERDECGLWFSRLNVACGSLAWVGEEKPSMASTEPEASLWGKMENVKPWSIIKWSANASTPINTYSRWKCPAVGNVLDNVACTMINTHTLDSCFKESILSYIFYASGSLYILDSVPLSMWYSSRSFILNVYLLNI